MVRFASRTVVGSKGMTIKFKSVTMGINACMETVRIPNCWER